MTVRFQQTVLDCTNARELAEFYRELLDLTYRPGDETPQDGEDWLVLVNESGGNLAFQQIAELAEATWPDGPRPQQLHLDLVAESVEELAARHEWVLGRGARLLLDRSDDPQEPLYVYADPAGHPFCIFVSLPHH
jgi:hypothetical protein